jgi:hypothetical protein
VAHGLLKGLDAAHAQARLLGQFLLGQTGRFAAVLE